MTLTQSQLQARAAALGCSDLPALFGVSRFANVADLWHVKQGHVVPDEPSDAAEMGTMAEDFIADLAAKKLGVRLVKPTGTYKSGFGLHANLDRQVSPAKRGSVNVECKCVAYPDGWGDEGTDQVPDGAMLQVQGQMLCSQAPKSYVARLYSSRWGLRFALYEIAPHRELMRLITEKVEWFRGLTECPAPGPRLDTLERMVRETGKMVEVSDRLLERLSEAKQKVRIAEAEEDEARAAVLEAMGDAEHGVGETRTVSYTASKRRSMSKEKAIAAGVYDAICVETSVRSLRIKEKKDDNGTGA